MKNNNLSSLDVSQMNQRMFDESNDAQRVIVVGQDINIDTDKITDAVKEGLKDIKINVEQNKDMVSAPIMETKIEKIEVPQIIKEIQIERIEVPIVTTRIERVEIPIIVPTIEIIEKPIIIKEIEIREIATKETIYLRAAVIAQALILLVLLLKH